MMTGSRMGAFCVAGSGILLCGLALLWPEPKERNPFTLAVGVWPGMETLTLARESQQLPAQGLNFVELSWTSATMMAFGNRVVDGAVVTLDEMLRLRSGGHDIKAVLVVGASHGGDAIVARREVTSLQQLRGKRVGVELRAAGEYLLTRALSAAGMTLKDVTIVPINLAEAEAAFDERELDAVVTMDPWRIRLLEKGARVLYDSGQLPAPLYRVLVVRRDLLDDRQGALTRLVNAHFDSLPQLRQGSGEGKGMDAVLRRERLTRKQLASSFESITSFPRETNVALLGQGAESLEPVLREMAGFMKEKGLLEAAGTAEDLLDDRLVKGE